MMSAPVNTEEYFKENVMNFEALEKEATHSIKTFLNEANIKIHSVSSRVKDLNSYTEKIKRFAASGKDDAEINDIVGLRVLCLFMSDVERIGDLLKEKFEVVSVDNKIRNQDAETFGYLSDHYILRLKKDLKGPRYDGIKKFKFEIQVRTVAMDAWATISHYLDYKSDTDIPKELKKSFMALSGLFYVADVNFEQLYGESKKSKQDSINVIKGKSNAKVELNLDTLRAYLLRRYPKRKKDRDAYSSLLNELIMLGMETVSQLDESLRGTDNALRVYERDNPPRMGVEGDFQFTKFSAVGAVRMALALSSETYRNMTDRDEAEYTLPRYQKLLSKEKR